MIKKNLSKSINKFKTPVIMGILKELGKTKWGKDVAEEVAEYIMKGGKIKKLPASKLKSEA